jgi:threonine synthase
LSPLPSSIVCAGCGATAPRDEPYPFRCPEARPGDDIDHVMTRVLDRSQVTFPDDDEEPNPFVRYRTMFHSYHLALAHGMSDEDYLDLVRRIDKEVASVDGRGFTVTPFGRSGELSSRLGFSTGGGVWVKDETGSVSGSHKARHLMGLLIHLEVVERVGLANGADRDLAMASCGNAALAAAVVARAGGRTLRVFVPTWGDPEVIARLKELRANVNVVRRKDGVSGDPTYHELQRAIEGGALPFTCQGNENGLVIEGGTTLGYELASQLAQAGATLDRVFVQVGGGALASAMIQGLGEAKELGAVESMPRIHTVQTAGGHPLKRAYERLVNRITGALGEEAEGAGEEGRAELIATRLDEPAVQDALAYAVHHRSEFMWPWEEAPTSIASGILDDETYDWAVVVRGMLETGGWPLTVTEETLIEVNDAASQNTGTDVDHTGSAGLAGLFQLRQKGIVQPIENVGVLFTGVRRGRET